MRKILLLLFVVCSVQLASAQTYTVRKKAPKPLLLEINDSIRNNQIIRAGNYLRKSANMQYASLGCLAGGGLFCVAAVTSDKKAMYAPAGIMFFGSILCGVFSIQYKMNAGKELILSGNKIQFKF